MSRAVAVLLILSVLALLATPSFAEDQKFAVRFGIAVVRPAEDAFDAMGGFEVDFEWYFHPRIGLEAAGLGSASASVELGDGRVSGWAFSTFTVGINGHVVRTEKVDFALGLLAGRATYGDFDIVGQTTTLETKNGSTFGAQAFVDVSVSRKWAVDVGLKYQDAQIELERRPELDFSPVIFRVMGVYRWGQRK